MSTITTRTWLWAGAVSLGGWAWLLTWPGTALLLVALAYSHFGVNVFQKHGGRTSWAARTLLLPYQIGAWTSSRWFTRAIPARAEVAPGVWIGRVPGREGPWARHGLRLPALAP